MYDPDQDGVRELAAGEEYYTNENPVEWQYFNEAEPASDGIFSGIYESYKEKIRQRLHYMDIEKIPMISTAF